MQRRQYIFLLMSGLIMVTVLAGCSLFSAGELTTPDPDNTIGTLLFSDDFAADTIDDPPSRWTVHNDSITVVEDLAAEGGRAVKMLAPTTGYSTFSVKLSSEDPVVVVDYSVRAPVGNGTNFYLNGLQYQVNIFVDSNNNLGYRYTDPESKSLTTTTVGPLSEGWNRVRVVANVDDQEAYVYLNNLHEAAIGPLAFRNPISDWSLIEPLFHVAANTPSSETYYSDIKVWSLTSEQAAALPK